ncbi:unnamed protein product [Phytophthora fragariaefolia]|uniref:Unnamed protein product n=1 Tax=Phytophthora fragariaefolia TaxID=1490495 RepID=A0A9W6UF72_9STRA|nr:unnamed protein product [Phytophthora fragariaefolia]
MACDKLEYLLQRPKPFRMYCDHRNLIHVFAPHESVKKHVKGKLLRWAMKLMNCRYVIEHVPGHANVWADMISRWAGDHTPTVERLKAFRAAQAVECQPVSVLRPLDDEHFEWPTLDELREVHSKYSPPPNASCNEDGLWVRDDRLWIPTEATELLQRLCVVAHCGAQGHRGQHAMTAHLRQLFSVDHIADIVATFVKNCLLCLHFEEGKVVPRPWSETIDWSTRNGVLHLITSIWARATATASTY